jgi:tRNA (cytidine/uridine-2'-O-)-methyltransferase
MEIVLIYPEIPQNSGSAARVAAATATRIHFIKPLGFKLEDRYLKRAGLDYWPMVDLVVHEDLETALAHFEQQSVRPLSQRLKLFSARGGKSLFETKFEADDLLCFGSESKGIPAALLEAHPGNRVYIPIKDGVRSLNLASVVCLGLYTAKVSAGEELPSNDGSYAAHPERSRDLFAADIASFPQASPTSNGEADS